MDLLPGVRSSLVDTDRIRMRVLEAGPADAAPVVLVHGNVSTSRFYEREVLDRYAAAGGSVRVEIIEGSGHGPHLDAAPCWLAIFQDFLATIG